MLEKVEAIYGAMRAHKFAMGDALQTAANIMYLADGAPRAVASRAAALRDEFRSHKVRIQQRDYDELAILSILDLPAHRIVPRVLDVRESLGAIRPRIDAATRFDVAVGITFLELAARDGRTAAVSGAKVLMDMQAVVAAQQAMLAAAAAAGAASAASSGGGN